MEILFLDSNPSAHHERFVDLFSILGKVHSVYIDLHQEPPTLQFDLVVFADLDITFDYATKFAAPRVGISWAWDLQQTLRQGVVVRERLDSALNSLDLLIVDSHTVEKQTKQYGLSTSRIFRAPYGIDIEDYPPRIIQKTHTGKLRLYTNRRWEELYRPEILLEMALEFSKEGPTFELVLANDGSFRKPLIEKFSSLFSGGYCRWIGKISPVKNKSELGKSDLYLSVSKSDGASLSLLEAMAIGVPPVVTDNPANREWIEDGESGYLFSGSSGLELAEVIRRIDINTPRKFNMAQLAREKILQEANWSQTKIHLLARIRETLKREY